MSTDRQDGDDMVAILGATLGTDVGFCGLCALVVVARACTIPGATLESTAGRLTEWLHADFGPVPAAAFEALSLGERPAEGVETSSVGLLLGRQVSGAE